MFKLTLKGGKKKKKDFNKNAPNNQIIESKNGLVWKASLRSYSFNPPATGRDASL